MGWGTGKGTDRRAHDRFAVKEGSVAFLGVVPATVVDISEGGMAVRFVVMDRMPESCFPLDIFSEKEDFYLRELSAELVSTTDLPPASSFSVIMVKRVGIRFAELNNEQKERLKCFINNMTTGVLSVANL